MPVRHPAIDVPVPRMFDDIVQHILIVEQLVLVDIRFVHEMDIIVKSAPVVQQRLDRNGRVGEPGQVFGDRIMDIQLAVLPELQRSHRRKGLRHRSQVKGRMRRQRILSHPRVLEPFIALIKDHAVLGDQYAAVEAPRQHRIEETTGDGSIALQFGAGQCRDGTREERK